MSADIDMKILNKIIFKTRKFLSFHVHTEWP